MKNCITCETLLVSYGSDIVLKDLSFSLAQGEVLSVLGENGAGKSTLLKCLLGLLKPEAGSITPHGFSFREVGYLPQQTAPSPHFPASVFEVVLSGCLNLRGAKPFYSKKEKQIALFNLQKVGVVHLKHKRFCSLSGGEQRRVLLARALCSAKKLLVLDEPAAGLDPLATKELYRVISDLKNDGMTIIMVSHDTHGALSICDRVLHLASNHSDYFFGSPEDYKASRYARNFQEVRV